MDVGDVMDAIDEKIPNWLGILISLPLVVLVIVGVEFPPLGRLIRRLVTRVFNFEDWCDTEEEIRRQRIPLVDEMYREWDRLRADLPDPKP